MQINETTYKKLPDHLKHLFTKLPNPGSPEVLAGFPEAGAHGGKGVFVQHAWAGREATEQNIERSTGSAARFFYCAKASRSDRSADNNHPTVKPTDLMRYLCRLVTPPGGVVLDPFMGSGSTGKAAVIEGVSFTGIERDTDYFEIACRRIEQAQSQGDLFPPEEKLPVQEALL